MQHTGDEHPVLVLGATGYVGGRLVPMLLDQGVRVRAGSRSAEKIRCRPYGGHELLEAVSVNVLDRASLQEACAGCRAAYYLVHSMEPGRKDFASADRQAAQNMVRAAEKQGLSRLIYLSGLGEQEGMSKHLRSRHEVGEILQSGRVPVTVLRAAMIMGSGSASFEILRYLVERLPVMTTPRWVSTENQPIAISNVLGYLTGCLDHPETAGQVYDVGGPDVLSYRELFDIYAEEAGLRKRIIIPLPVLTPRLSSYWIHLVTPVPGALARPLAEGLSSRVVCRETRIREIIPQRLLTCRETIRRAIDTTRQMKVASCWMDAGAVEVPEWVACGDVPYAGGTVFQSNYRVTVDVSAAALWTVVGNIGGRDGWYHGNRLWGLRGLLDKLTGGVGLSRGRRPSKTLGVGDVVGFWRVLALEQGRRLQLLAEMKMPGEAILEFRLSEEGPGRTVLEQIARFRPRGLGGILYWYALLPTHGWLFKGMLKSMARAAGARTVTGPEPFELKTSACPLGGKEKK